MKQEYRANGKLLLTGEYFVLAGAKALAIPTRYGQSLQTQAIYGAGTFLAWHSLNQNNQAWFSAIFSLDDLHIRKSTNDTIALRLQKVLRHAQEINPQFPQLFEGLKVSMQMDFPGNWGLGSSSTMISLIAQWAKVDPFQLQFEAFGGSGYDIACATAQQPIFYQKTPQELSYTEAPFVPPFSKHLYFVHLNQKQNSRTGINHFNVIKEGKMLPIKEITSISEELCIVRELKDFAALLEKHENISSDFLELPKVKDLHFSDYWGAVKSLGAWGGDFVLASSEQSEEKTRQYFEEKGFSTVIPYADMIL